MGGIEEFSKWHHEWKEPDKRTSHSVRQLAWSLKKKIQIISKDGGKAVVD